MIISLFDLLSYPITGCLPKKTQAKRGKGWYFSRLLKILNACTFSQKGLISPWLEWNFRVGTDVHKCELSFQNTTLSGPISYFGFIQTSSFCSRHNTEANFAFSYVKFSKEMNHTYFTSNIYNWCLFGVLGKLCLFIS